MAGLYDGLEEVAFKRTEGGYVFQANNRFLIGPRRRFLVNEAQKADIAACMRETLRRIKPFVFVMMAALRRRSATGSSSPARRSPSSSSTAAARPRSTTKPSAGTAPPARSPALTVRAWRIA
jgi:hypothetical protein